MPDSNPEVNALCDGDPLARSLAALRPAPAGLDPTRLVYLAGQAARDRSVAFWRRVAVAQGLAVVGLVGLAVVHFSRLTELETQVADLRSKQPAPAARPEATAEPAPMPREVPDPPAVPYQPGNGGFTARAKPDEPTAAERAKWLQLRNDVLAAGLGVLPTPARPQPVPDGSVELPRGVLAIPPAPPKSKPEPPPE